MDGKVKYLTIPFIKHNYLALPFKELKIADLDHSVSGESLDIESKLNKPYKILNRQPGEPSSNEIELSV